jgi:hypothetical protein
MLYRSDGTSFVIGVTTFYDTNPINPGRQNSIYLRAVLSREMGVSVHAMVDSGAPNCLFDSDIGEMLGWDYSAGEPAELSPRVGRFSGTIQRLPIIIAAEEGDSLQIEASVFLSQQWRFGNFLGYSGFLECFCFALEPATNSFFFGPSE